MNNKHVMFYPIIKSNFSLPLKKSLLKQVLKRIFFNLERNEILYLGDTGFHINIYGYGNILDKLYPKENNSI